MSNPFQDLFAGGDPQRRVLKFRVARDVQGHVVLQPLEGQAHLISPDNSLDTINLDPDAFLDCGCSVRSNQPRYRCCEPGCAHVVCEQHVRYCQVCAKGLCGQCQNFLVMASGERIDLCPTHYAEARRRRWWRQLAQSALRPFVAVESKGTPK